jgi:hypothetical protein
MTKSIRLLIAAIVPLVGGMCVATGSNAQSMTADAAYCQTLAQKYSEYVGLGANAESRRGPPDVDAGVAISECQNGNSAAGIPVLEQKLRDSRIDLPARQ